MFGNRIYVDVTQEVFNNSGGGRFKMKIVEANDPSGTVRYLVEADVAELNSDIATQLKVEREDRMRQLARNQDDMVALARTVNELRGLLAIAEHELVTLNGLTATDQPGAFDSIHAMRKWTIDTTGVLDKIRKGCAPIAPPAMGGRIAGAGLPGGGGECDEDMQGDEVEHVRPDNATRIGKAIINRFHDDAPYIVEKTLRVLQAMGYSVPRKGLSEWLQATMLELRTSVRTLTDKWKRAERACQGLAEEKKEALEALNAMELRAEAKLGEAAKLHLADLRMVLFHQIAEQQNKVLSKRESASEFFARIQGLGKKPG